MKRGGGRGRGERVFPYFSLFKKETSLSSPISPSVPTFCPHMHTVCGRKRSKIAILLLYIFSVLLFFCDESAVTDGPLPLFSPFNNIYFPPPIFVKSGKEEEIWRSSSRLVNAEFFLTGCPLPSPNSDTNTHLVLAENALRFFFFLFFPASSPRQTRRCQNLFANNAHIFSRLLSSSICVGTCKFFHQAIGSDHHRIRKPGLSLVNFYCQRGGGNAAGDFFFPLIPRMKKSTPLEPRNICPRLPHLEPQKEGWGNAAWGTENQPLSLSIPTTTAPTRDSQ